MSYIGTFAPGETFFDTVTTFEPDNPEILKAATSINWEVFIDNVSTDTGVVGDTEFTNPSTGLYLFAWAIPGGTAKGAHMEVRYTAVVPDSGATGRTAYKTSTATVQPDITELLTGAGVQELIFGYLIEGLRYDTLMKRFASIYLGETAGPPLGTPGVFNSKAMGAPGTQRVSATVDANGYRSALVFTD